MSSAKGDLARLPADAHQPMPTDLFPHCHPAPVLCALPDVGRRWSHGIRKTSGALAALVLWQAAAAQPHKAPAPASNPAAPSTQLVVSRVVQQAGAELLAAATSVQPGDVLHYTATFSNPGLSSLRDVVASMPVPVGTAWVPNSAQPVGVLVSVDGKHFAPMPLMRTQLLAGGRSVDVPVPVSEIRFLRWPPATLAAGERFATSLRVRVVLGAEPGDAAAAVPSSAKVAAR
jgi:uncharacterized repeat protein (TIGR01451 family)